jgi:hypothetical protein
MVCIYIYILNPKLQVHLAPGSKFDFQKYIKRFLEDDFKVIVGISPTLWASALIFLFLNVNGWHTMLWTSILSVGTKLQDGHRHHGAARRDPGHPARQGQRLLLLVRQANLRALPHPLHALPERIPDHHLLPMDSGSN